MSPYSRLDRDRPGDISVVGLGGERDSDRGEVEEYSMFRHIESKH